MVSAGLLYADNKMVHAFASCAGRFSAEVEHAWLLNDPIAEDYGLLRSGFVSLLDATTTAENADLALNHRVNSKHAHAQLLQTATFDPDATKANAARQTAKHFLDQCNLLILGGA